MRRDSAGVVDPTLSETQGDELEAEALAALDALWRSESERTDIMQPQHIGALLPGSREGDLEQTTRLPDPDAVEREDPGWDDERELTEALDFDRLAPWQASESEPVPDWTLELTTSYDRPAQDIGELDWDEAAELTHRMDSPPRAAKGLEFRRDEASTARGLPSGKKEHDAEKQRAGGRGSVPSARESTVQPRSGKRVGRETLPARGNRPKPARATLRSGWPLSAAHEHDHLLPATHALRAWSQPSAASVRGARASSPAEGRVRPIAASAATTSRRPALRTAAWQPAGGDRVTHGSFPQPDPAQPAAAKSGPRPALRAAATYASLAPAELERPAEPRRMYSSLWWAAGGAAFVALCVAVRFVAGGTAEPVQVAVEPPVPQSTETVLSLTSHPAGAQIFVDGEDTGLTTPSRVRDLSPGLHAVELKLAGHYATGLPATLGQGETLELPAIELRPLPVAVELPGPGNQLEAADAPAPPRRSSARRSARRQPTASSLSAEELAVAREPEPAADGGGSGLLQINSRPWARILVDGEFVGNTPQLRLRLSAGTHTVRLVNEPLRMSKTLKLTIRDGETLTKVETLSEDAAQSRVAIQGNEALAVR